MGLGKNVYICNQCKKLISDIEELLFVEENSPRGFCSEKCIEGFYTPLFNHFENAVKKYREELKLEDEECLELLRTQSLLIKFLLIQMKFGCYQMSWKKKYTRL